MRSLDDIVTMVFELGLGHFPSVPRVTVVVKYCLMKEFVMIITGLLEVVFGTIVGYIEW